MRRRLPAVGWKDDGMLAGIHSEEASETDESEGPQPAWNGSAFVAVVEVEYENGQHDGPRVHQHHERRVNACRRQQRSLSNVCQVTLIWRHARGCGQESCEMLTGVM